MDQQIRDGDHYIFSTLIGCIVVVVIYATTAQLSSENPDTWNRQESIELTVKHKPRRQGKQEYCFINMGSLR